MNPRGFSVAVFALSALILLIVIAVSIAHIRDMAGLAPDQAEAAARAGGVAAFMILLICGLGALALDRRVMSPLAKLARLARNAAQGGNIASPASEAFGGIAPLAAPVLELARQKAAAQDDLRRKVAEAVAETEEQKSRLAATLRDLHEGVAICNLGHQILLYNQRALELLHVAGDLGLGRSLFSVLQRRPFQHGLERLSNRVRSGRHHIHPQGLTAPFVSFTLDGRRTLEGRMSLILDADEKPSGYVITFDDHTEHMNALGKRDSLLRKATEGLQGQVATLRAAAETLATHPEMSQDARADFIAALDSESLRLGQRLEVLVARFRQLFSSHWPMSDIDSANLLACVARRMEEERGLKVTMTGLPVWFFVDSHSVVELLDHLISSIHQHAEIDAFDIAAEFQDKHAYVDIIWKGEPIADGMLSQWLESRLEAMGSLSGRDVIEHHRSEIWSKHFGRDGLARLRVPLPHSQRMETVGQNRASLPPRPEFYDFGLMRESADARALGDKHLRALSYVVFDTETTGLHPDEGDQIIQIAGVRVVNGRILTGETFDRLVNPGREIPKDSIRFHGITDDMVQDKPPARLVLPQFKDFVGDFVLVAHNAAFDMRFLKLKEADSGVRFENPVIDTLLLSALLHGPGLENSLDDLAERFGVTAENRHTALGDSMTTAGVLLRLIELLEARGVKTLNDALRATHKMAVEMSGR